MKVLTQEEFDQLRKDIIEVIEEDAYGWKVARLTNGSFLKFFRTKRLISSAVLYPYAKRFSRNASKLKELGFETVSVINLYKIKDPNRDIVHYQPLHGETLRNIAKVQNNGLSNDLIKQLGSFIAELHEKGVYFRSLHLGNVVLTKTGTLGLIDISDMKFYSKLSTSQKIRNFRHMFRYKKDANLLTEKCSSAFIDGYFSSLNNNDYQVIYTKFFQLLQPTRQ
ncbi:protein kinase family protein [Spartinivicinus ruber]|uniref:toluene tolerance protein n=1 Tax=Spartinivicinus ruber TaxID=2683272 RepID=UPI001CA3D7F1|nr:toluene tolerance protein [Spartinivicinus ruber]